MGDPKRLGKKYSSLKRPWDKTRIGPEKAILEKYGLSAKHELRVAEEYLRRKRHSAKRLLVTTKESSTKDLGELVSSLNRLGLLSQDATLTDVLALTTVDILERRLQTVVCRHGLANSLKQARQFILHGFIAINNKRVRSPSYLVKRDEEQEIGYFEGKKPKVLEVIRTPELQKVQTPAETPAPENAAPSSEPKDVSSKDV